MKTLQAQGEPGNTKNDVIAFCDHAEAHEAIKDSIQRGAKLSAEETADLFEDFVARGLSAQQAADAAIRRFEPQHRGRV